MTLGLLFGAPYVPPRPAEPVWVGLPMTWTGWDGSEWSLTDRRQGIVLKPGVRGLHMPTFERHSTKAPALPGSRHRGTSVLDRDCFWPVKVWSDQGSAAWLERDRAFWHSLDTEEVGTWTVHHPGGATRSLDLRLVNAPDEFTRNPLRLGWATYGVELLADQPYWRGDTVAMSWGEKEVRPYDVTEADREVYGYADDVIHYLSSGSSLADATFTNDGDVPAYPVWTITGQTTAVSFGVEGSTTRVPFEIPKGYAVRLDTDPARGQVLWYGTWDSDTKVFTPIVDRTAELDPASKFAPIPRGQDRKLSLAMTGTGIVMAELTPLHRRAF